MKILITGATGLIGNSLVKKLLANGYFDINVLTRNVEKSKKESEFPVKYFFWNPFENKIDSDAFVGVQAVIHLAGENVASKRWSVHQKELILNSRVLGTKLLISEIKKLKEKPLKFISSSAVGVYGNDFLAKVCQSWEKEVFNHDFKEMSTHCIRTGVVLSNEGGALMKMLPAFLLGLGGNLGNGKQIMNWIHIDDLVAQYIFILENNVNAKTLNGVAPQVTTNSEFTKCLSAEINRPAFFNVPAAMLKIILGEMSNMLLMGNAIEPKEFLTEGFKFKFSSLESSLADLLYDFKKNIIKFENYTMVSKSLNEVFDFFSKEKNLELITPSFLNFKVLEKNTEKIEKGTVIKYELSLYKIKFNWISKISEFVPNHFFIDEQIKGPYKSWVHRHEFIESNGNTLMMDVVKYKIPFGFLGKIVAGSFVKKNVKEIFKYRNSFVKEKLY